jgi:hypothetical protein
MASMLSTAPPWASTAQTAITTYEALAQAAEQRADRGTQGVGKADDAVRRPESRRQHPLRAAQLA